MTTEYKHDIPGWDRQTRPEKNKPYGWIQWKGTRVCIDIHCVCGNHGHIDDEFIYYIKCANCGRKYMVNGHVELVPLTKEELETSKNYNLERAVTTDYDMDKR